MEEATLAGVKKQVGEAVERDENLIDIETDKRVLEVCAPQSGVLVEIRRNEGDTVTGLEVIATIDVAATASETAQATPVAMPEAVAMPAAKKMAAETGVNLDEVVGSGVAGVFSKKMWPRTWPNPPRNRLWHLHRKPWPETAPNSGYR